RDPKAITLLAVSKTKPASLVRAAYACGQRDFGENYVQELLAKSGELADLVGLRWHAIGHIQTNKARDVARVAHVVHTLDSARVAQELGRRAEAGGAVLEAFVQVNVGGEVQKSGCEPDAVGEVIAAVQATRGLRLRGLMTVPPHTDDPAGARPYFEALVAVRERHGGATLLPDLSMGMTHDLDVAVACGATLVRVGSAIFGDR
ncbi:MAG: YggS family pyridoxal phosphate-dependent enzyme, partial [Deltaproteobacteria bacterium]